ncbi:hypothetical protein HK098_004447 [Nowakowskiella sp. JEL0407]|nr:hypothetical protein HK098_004447 [Nowakowskiella sp. JEL0407]
MPVYNELPDVESKHPKNQLHLVLAFDDVRETPLYLQTLRNLDHNHNPKDRPPIIDMNFRGVKITVCRFPHGGKRLTQSQAFKLIEEQYHEMLSMQKFAAVPKHQILILFLDSDINLDNCAVPYFVNRLMGSKNCMAVTGLINCSTPAFNFWWLLQDIEYVHGQMLERVLESACGSVTCLPGALTMVKLEALQKVAAKYFTTHQLGKMGDLFDYARYHLGEDRYLTHLFMELGNPYSIKFIERAHCKTEAPETLTVLLKQRRRWMLGAVSNEVAMLTTPILWKKYPILLLIRLLHSSFRSVSLLTYVIVITMILNKNYSFIVPLIAFCAPLVLNWGCMIYFGFKLHRLKVLFYPVLYITYPFLQWMFNIYAIFTCAKKTWGGPRTVDPKSRRQSIKAEDGSDSLGIIELYSEEYSRNIYVPKCLYSEAELQELAKRIGPSEDDYSEIALNITSSFSKSPSTRASNILMSPAADTHIPRFGYRNSLPTNSIAPSDTKQYVHARKEMVSIQSGEILDRISSFGQTSRDMLLPDFDLGNDRDTLTFRRRSSVNSHTSTVSASSVSVTDKDSLRTIKKK